jgi:hypothetical protein
MTSGTEREKISAMDQRSNALYLSTKGLSAKLIHQTLVDILGFETVAYSTVTWYLRTARFVGQREEYHHRGRIDK